MKKYPKNYCVILAAVFTCCASLVFILRAAISGITYDEAFTYLAYAKPLADSPDLNTVKNIYWGSVANNHWLNTFLIALICKITDIHYNEFLIRLPSVLAGCCYMVVVFWEYKKKNLNGIQFMILSACYYMEEFFSLARGYGMAAAFVLFGLLFYQKWIDSDCLKHQMLLLSIGCFILSAYGNSVTLVVCFCIGIMMLYRLLYTHQFFPFLRKTWPVIFLFAVMGFLIVKYHFRVSGEGMVLWASESTSFLNLIAEYISMILCGNLLIKIVSLILPILTLAFSLFLFFRKKLLQCDFGLACIIYFVCLILMDAVFHRGGLYGRTLLPAYPLAALGIYQLLSCGIREMKQVCAISLPMAAYRVCAGIFITLIGIMFISKIDLTRTRDWYNDYNIKTDFYANPDFESNDVHTSVVFYTEKRDWDYEHLLQEYSGKEENSYIVW